MTAPDETHYLSALETWHSQRLAALTKDDGWLSVAGLEWLDPGVWRFGSAPDNDIVIAGIPARAGTIAQDAQGTVTVSLDPSAGGAIDGQALQEAQLSAGPEAPTRVTFGSMSFYLIERNGRKALRILDGNSRNRRTFSAIPRFPVDPSWRIVADWVVLETPRPFEVDSVIGIPSTIMVSHKAVFSRDGRSYELWPTHGTENAPMFVLRDGTSGRETYGASRFLVGEIQKDRIVLDFNKAINPPCAFTDFATCPLPPSENRLPLHIAAGEMLPLFQAEA
ncbi:hypothetical protein GGR34_000085 [Microvirga flocculans]|uniref:DUF1684 domain-containing protein n=1 Tax=Microvirga flocculans TaxID=217168 RepID=A0A7W6IC64_9HYPH|nr:DUF1684 domain-containing protein [Microvirga flocculans]MBB4038456.1 hypothetical protein [Microvirga flocculans]